MKQSTYLLVSAPHAARLRIRALPRLTHRLARVSSALIQVAICALPLSTANAEDTNVTLQNVSAQRLAQLREPALIDVDLLQERVRQLKAGLKALTHMSEMIRETHARRALSAQVTALEATLSELEGELKETIKVSYQLTATPNSPPHPSRRGRDLSSDSSAPAFIDEPIGEAREPSAHRPLAHTADAPKVIQATPQATPQPPQVSPRGRTPTAVSVGDSMDPTEKRAMSAAQLSRYWSAIEAAAFRDDKMKVIKRVAREAHLTVAQAEVLIESLTFSRDRKEAILILYPRLTDPSEVQSLYRLLDHSSHRRDVRRRVRQLGARRHQ